MVVRVRMDVRMRVAVLVRVGVPLSVVVRVGAAVIVCHGFGRRVAVLVRVPVLQHAELRGRDAGTEDALGGNAAVLDGEAPERPADDVERNAEIEQGAENHVA